MSTDGPYNNVIKIKPPLVFNKDNVDFAKAASQLAEAAARLKTIQKLRKKI